MANTQPTKQNVLDSLASAVDATHQAYMTAFNANPGADLSQLYLKEMAARATLNRALNAALSDNPGIVKAQTDLDEVTKIIRNELSTIKNVSTWSTLLDNLVKLAAIVGAFFV